MYCVSMYRMRPSTCLSVNQGALILSRVLSYGGEDVTNIELSTRILLYQFKNICTQNSGQVIISLFAKKLFPRCHEDILHYKFGAGLLGFIFDCQKYIPMCFRTLLMNKVGSELKICFNGFY